MRNHAFAFGFRERGEGFSGMGGKFLHVIFRRFPWGEGRFVEEEDAAGFHFLKEGEKEALLVGGREVMERKREINNIEKSGDRGGITEKVAFKKAAGAGERCRGFFGEFEGDGRAVDRSVRRERFIGDEAAREFGIAASDVQEIAAGRAVGQGCRKCGEGFAVEGVVVFQALTVNLPAVEKAFDGGGVFVCGDLHGSRKRGRKG